MASARPFLSLWALRLASVCGLFLLLACNSSPPPQPVARTPVTLPPPSGSTPVLGHRLELETRPYTPAPASPEITPTPRPLKVIPPAPRPTTTRAPRLPGDPSFPKATPRQTPLPEAPPPSLPSGARPRPQPLEPVDPQAPVEIEIVPPPDMPALRKVWKESDPQAVLKTPAAVHFGYSYSQGMQYLVRDRLLKMQVLGVGGGDLTIWLENTSKRPLHFFFFPGQIFKPRKDRRFSALILTGVEEAFLYPGSRRELRLSGYSLDRRKPLVDPRFPVEYALAAQRDNTYTRALLVLQALLTQESAHDFFLDREFYQAHRSLILQTALWRATSGNYNPSEELRQALRPGSLQEFEQQRKRLLTEVDSLHRLANQL